MNCRHANHCSNARPTHAPPIAPTTVEALNADTPAAQTPDTELPSATVTPLAPAARKEAVEAAAPADLGGLAVEGRW